MPSDPAAQIHKAFEQAFNAGSLEALIALYEPDAVLAAQPGLTVQGHEAIREAYRGFLAIRPVIHVETVAALEHAGGIVLAHGRWSMTGTDPETGAEIRTNGRNTEVLRRQPGGEWLFAIDNPFTPEG